MKCLGARTEDRSDTRFLARMLGLHAHDDAVTIVGRHHPAGRILPKTRFTLEELFGAPSG